jgi:hypothetical protein
MSVFHGNSTSSANHRRLPPYANPFPSLSTLSADYEDGEKYEVIVMEVRLINYLGYMIVPFGIGDEIINGGARLCETAAWNSNGEGAGIRRESCEPNILAPTRFGIDIIALHWGCIERILQNDFASYSERGVERPSRLIDAKIDEIAMQTTLPLLSLRTRGTKDECARNN